MNIAAKSTAIGLASLVAYTLSIGPVMRAADFNSPIQYKAVNTLYAPIFFVTDQRPSLSRLMVDYVNLFFPPGEIFDRG
jgi:hypothetical protein